MRPAPSPDLRCLWAPGAPQAPQVPRKFGQKGDQTVILIAAAAVL